MSDLHLALKAEYFEAIRAGTKTEEYRLTTPYWRKRLEGRSFDQIELTWGYPKADDQSRRLLRPWRGYRIITITHPHFGDDPVEVFAIDVTGRFPYDQP
jgi:hypothetical protein